jgi:hypothetical protein
MALETAGDVGSNYRMAGDRIANRRSPRLRNPTSSDGASATACRVESKEVRKWLDNKPQLKGRLTTMAHQPPTRPITAPIMTPFFNLPIGPSGHSVRHGKTRSPKADLTTLLKMRRATQVHHEYARLSDRANVSHVRLPMRHQNFDFREGVGRPARPHGALELGRRRHPTR